MPSPIPSVTVNRSDLANALKWLKPHSRSRKMGRASIKLSSGELTLEAALFFIGIRAEGQWDGVARFAPLVYVATLEGLPNTDEIRIRVDGDRLKLGGYSFPCEWTAASES